MKQIKHVSPVKFYLLGGIPFYILLALKLFGVVPWSWWWITLPVWLPFTLFTLLVMAFFTFVLRPASKDERRRMRRKQKLNIE